jgi:uncharacterized CHY-type Zn-finger protein
MPVSKVFIMLILLGLAVNLPTKAQENLHPAALNTPIVIQGTSVFGKPVDRQTRCVHWHSELDIIAIKFKCCDQYYPCYSCHEETTDHEPEVWPVSEFDQKAILCGACGHELAIREYLGCNNTCPNCASQFNPGCSKHYHLYFETKKPE